MTTYQTQDQALLQLSAPRHIRGRVMSFYLISRELCRMARCSPARLLITLAAPPPFK